MGVAAAENQIVLLNQGGGPDVIGGYGRSLLSKLSKDSGIVECGLFIGKKNDHARTIQEFVQDV